MKTIQQVIGFIDGWIQSLPSKEEQLTEEQKHILNTLNDIWAYAVLNNEGLPEEEPKDLKEDEETYLRRLEDIAQNEDIETRHQEADDLLCKLILEYVPFGTPIVLKFYKMDKWYS